MSNSIKYNTSSESNALTSGNFHLGVGDVAKGPTSSTGYWAGINPPSGGYTIYLNKASNGPSIYIADNDTKLISLTNTIGGQSFTTAAQCKEWFAGQNDKMLVNREYEKIVTDGLVFMVDAGFTPSYPTTGTDWYDLSGNGNDGTLTNGPTFDSGNGGSIVFDGTNDYTPFPYNTLYNFQYYSSFTIESWVYIDENNQYGYIITNRNTDASNVNYCGFGLAQRFGAIRGLVGGYPNGGFGWRQVDISTSDFNSYVYQKWAHIVYTNTGTAGEQKIHINGVDRSTGVVDGTNPPYTINYDSDHKVTIGASPADGTPAGHYLDAKISNIRMYNRALTSTEITQNYNAQKGRFGL